MGKEGFINDSKMAFKGTLNGILGAFIYELIISFIVSFVVTYIVTINNPSLESAGLEKLIADTYSSFPFAMLISLLGSVTTLIMFVVIFKPNRFKEICLKAINNKTLKYGAIGALCIIGFSIVYNSALVSILRLDSAGNANQENVVSLIMSQPILGFLSVVLLAPAVEEFTFRYSLFGGVYKKSKKLAYFASGLIFMLMHSISSFSAASGFNKDFLIELLYLPPYLFSGLALCYVYDKTNNVGASFVAHLLNNLISFLSIIMI